MKTIVFPFTYLSPPYLKGMEAFCRRLMILREDQTPLPAAFAPWIENGTLESRVPAVDKTDELEKALQSFQSWAGLYPDPRRSNMAIFKALGETIPFFDNTSPLKIRADITRRLRAGLEENAAAADAGDPLFAARLFLKMARLYDAESWELTRRLSDCNRLEKRLFENLQGEAGQSARASELPPPGEDPGEHLPRERIQAWSRLYLKLLDDDPEARGLYVTPSRSVLGWMEETVPALEPVLEMGVQPGEEGNRLPGQLEAVCAELAMAADPRALEQKAPGAQTPTRLRLYAAFGIPVPSFFAALAGEDKGRAVSRRGGPGNTLVAFWEHLPA